MWRSPALAVTLVALAAWIGYCLVRYPPQIQDSLRTASTQALAVAGVTSVDLRVEGRNAVLEGSLPSADERAQVVSLVRGVPGIRRVDNRLQTAAPAGPEPVLPYLEIRSLPEGLVLLGPVVSEAARDALLAHAAELVGAPRVEDRLVVDPAAENHDASGSAVAILGVLAESEPGITVRLRGNSVRLSGNLSTEEARRRTDERFRETAADLRTIFSLLQVAPPEVDTETAEERGD